MCVAPLSPTGFFTSGMRSWAVVPVAHFPPAGPVTPVSGVARRAKAVEPVVPVAPLSLEHICTRQA